jgi:cysteine desulfurase/selenocysteine lyase
MSTMNIDTLADVRQRTKPATGAGLAAGRPFDPHAVRDDFPILRQKVHGKPLVYLDNAASTQKPQAVIDALRDYYEQDNANIHRGVHTLSERATRKYEEARVKVQRFLNARAAREIVFVRGTTEAINLVAQTFGRQNVRAGDEVLITHMEHHSNIVPWQILCEEKGASLRVAPITDEGELILEELERLLGPRTRLVAVVHVSNTLGTINPVKQVVEMAHRRGIPVLLDGAQAAPHLALDVQELGCDFYALSGHKLYGPTGTGVLYGKAELLEAMPPWQGGGDMISSVTFERTTYNVLPHKFEAGTPHIAGVIGLGAAIDYLSGIGLGAIAAYEHELLTYAAGALRQVPGLRLIGTAPERAGAISFVLDGVHPHDIGTILDREAVALRTGHHCTQPLMDRFGVPATARAALAFYNTREEVDALVRGLHQVNEVFG